MNQHILQQLANGPFPRYLTAEEIENPKLVLQQFHNMSQSTQGHEFFFHTLHDIITGKHTQIDIKDTSTIFYIHHQMQRLLEACYLIQLYSKLSRTDNNDTLPAKEQ